MAKKQTPNLNLGEIRKIPGTKTMYYIGVKRGGKAVTIKAQKRPLNKRSEISKRADQSRAAKTRISRKQYQSGFAHVGDTKTQQQTQGKKKKR